MDKGQHHAIIEALRTVSSGYSRPRQNRAGYAQAVASQELEDGRRRDLPGRFMINVGAQGFDRAISKVLVVTDGCASN